MEEKDLPRWLDPRIWVVVLLVGLLGMAGGLIWQARSMAPSGQGFVGPIKHRAPTRAFAQHERDPQPPPNPDEQAQSGFSAAGTLGSGEVHTDSFPLEGSGKALIFLSHPAGDLELELMSPSGHRYGPGQPSEAGFQYEKSSEGLFGLGPGKTVYIGLKRVEAGMWKARVTARAAPDSMPKVPFLLGSLLGAGSGGIAVRDLTPDRTSRVGESATIAVSVQENGRPVPDAHVTAYVPLSEDSAGVRVPLSDGGHAPDSVAGDGKYSGLTPKFPRPTESFYSIRASRHPSAEKAGFDRTVGGMLNVSRSLSHWTGRFRDFGADTTKDGLFDELIVEAEVEVTDSCQLSGLAVLVDSAGRRFETSFLRIDVDRGRRAIPIVFDGRELFEAGGSGRYSLSLLRLVEEDDQGSAPLDELRDSYRTRAYDRYEFQRDPHRILRVAGVKGIRPNKDGKFEVLEVDVEIEVDNREYIQCSAWLEDAAGRHAYAIQGSRTATYPPGRQLVQMQFPGGCVRDLGGDGHYRLRQFTLMGGRVFGPERDLDLPAIDPNQFAGPHELYKSDSSVISECGTKRP